MAGRFMRAAALALIIGGGLAGPVAARTESRSSGGRDTAAEARIHADVAFLADDALEGRGNGQRGYDMAALYVQTRMQGVGLQPGGLEGGWRQPFAVARARIGAEGASLRWTGPDGAVLSWTNGENGAFTPGREAGRKTGQAGLVFVGYGLSAPEQGLDDYAGRDVAGKIVVVLSGLPRGLDEAASQRLETDKARIAAAHGAVGVVTVNTAASAERMNDGAMRRLAGRTETGWAAPTGETQRGVAGVDMGVFLNDAAAEALFRGQAKSYADIRAEAASDDGRPAGFALNGQGAFDVTTAREDLAVSNVIGLIPGTDPALRGQYVVMTAHLDHIGMTGSGEDRINNGALDNAGGVAAMLEAARRLAADPPRRSVLIVALAAEEMGLIGSDYLARHPVVADVAANVNLDMPILTYGFSDVVAFGAEHSSLGPLVATAARAEGVSLSPDPMPEQNVFTRSDHYSFVRAGVPAVMLATGYATGGEAAWKAFFATNYHRPGDEVSAGFDWDAAARFARINAAIVSRIADADQRPLWYQGNSYGDRFAPGKPRAPAPQAADPAPQAAGPAH
jgi:hypothetical protein